MVINIKRNLVVIKMIKTNRKNGLFRYISSGFNQKNKYLKRNKAITSRNIERKSNNYDIFSITFKRTNFYFQSTVLVNKSRCL